MQGRGRGTLKRVGDNQPLPHIAEVRVRRVLQDLRCCPAKGHVGQIPICSVAHGAFAGGTKVTIESKVQRGGGGQGVGEVGGTDTGPHTLTHSHSHTHSHTHTHIHTHTLTHTHTHTHTHTLQFKPDFAGEVAANQNVSTGNVAVQNAQLMDGVDTKGNVVEHTRLDSPRHGLSLQALPPQEAVEAATATVLHHQRRPLVCRHHANQVHNVPACAKGKQEQRLPHQLSRVRVVVNELALLDGNKRPPLRLSLRPQFLPAPPHSIAHRRSVLARASAVSTARSSIFVLVIAAVQRTAVLLGALLAGVIASTRVCKARAQEQVGRCVLEVAAVHHSKRALVQPLLAHQILSAFTPG